VQITAVGTAKGEEMTDGLRQPSLANLMGMAGTAERAQNNEEALSYYNRVLEADPEYSEAWLGKGRAAAWLSTLSNIRINETVVAFGHAIATAPEEDKPTTASRAGIELGQLVTTLYGMAKRHHLGFPDQPAARETYVSAGVLLIKASVQASEWAPASRTLLELTVLMTRELLDLGLNEPLRTTLRETMDGANVQLSALDPEYVAPALASQTLADREAAKADMDNLGYIVAFIMMIIAVVVAAASRS
jgi:tetratricopeptide (TPR) repeat protein